MTIAATYFIAGSRDETVIYRYVCSWACADKITRRSRTKTQFEDGYELEQETICSHCGKRIRATPEE
jgi:hypothetical protein